MDKVAAYGIGGLVAGKVMAKAGLFAAALIFLKKFGVLIVRGHEGQVLTCASGLRRRGNTMEFRGQYT